MGFRDDRTALASGFEDVALAAFAGAAGYFFGSILPRLVGVVGLAA